MSWLVTVAGLIASLLKVIGLFKGNTHEKLGRLQGENEAYSHENYRLNRASDAAGRVHGWQPNDPMDRDRP